METLARCLLNSVNSTLEEFLEEHPHPVFVLDPFVEEKESGFETIAQEAKPGTERSVVEICKREGANSFAMMVTIGRAPNNDIAIPVADLSKFHAYLSRGTDQQLLLTDADSTFGTYVNERRLEPNAPGQTLLTDGTQVRLGKTLSLTFFSARGFHSFLLELASA